MKKTLSLIFFILMFSCNSNKQVNEEVKSEFDKVSESIINDTSHNNFTDVKTILKKNKQAGKFDSLNILKVSGKSCFNYNLDSINNDVYAFSILRDLSNSINLIKWHPFIGSFSFKKISNNKYEFIGTSYYPENGDLNKKSEEYNAIKYTLELNVGNYKFYEDTTYRLNLKYNRTSITKTIAKLEKEIFQDTICLSDNWEIANECYPKIEKYEFLLFASILNGNKSNIDKFLNLANNISIMNAGATAEYHEGNKLLLSIYGILPQEKYNPDEWIIERKKEIYCY